MKRRDFLFVMDGSVHEFEGSALELRTKITPAEWEAIVLETVKYRLFIQALKETGMPALAEDWARTDEHTLRKLKRSVQIIKNLDPLLLATIDSDKILKEYKAQMVAEAVEVNQLITTTSNDIVSAALAADTYPTVKLTSL